VCGVFWFAVRGTAFMVIAGGVLSAGAQASGGVLRLSCFAPSWVDSAQLEQLCRAVGNGMSDVLAREVEVVTDGATVALVVVRLSDSHVMARLHWPGTTPGPEVELGSVDARLTDQSFKAMAAGLLQVSPPP
jgi:hypothetical protein